MRVLIYYRDPLLDKICDRILELAEPAFIKNSELVYVAVNDAFSKLFNVSPSDLIGTGRSEREDIEALLDIEDKERACLVFGDEQASQFADPFGKGRFRIEMEKFVLGDGQTFLYSVFHPQDASRPVENPAKAVSTATQHDDTKAHEIAAVPAVALDRQQIDELLDELDVGLCVWNKERKLVYFNERLRTYYKGLIDDLYIGMHLRDGLAAAYDSLARRFPDEYSMAPDIRERRIDAKLAGYERERSSDYTQLANGSWLHTINRKQADGSIIGLRLDVTEMKNRETLLERHVEEVSLYRELLNRLPVAAFVRGPDQRLAFVNQAYSDLFGRSCDNLIGTDEFELLGSEAASIREINQDTLVNGSEYEREEELQVAHGRTVSTIVKTGRMVTGKGTPFLVGTIVDISTIRQRELLLQEANERAEAVRQDFENIISSVDVGLLVLDRDLNIQLMNEAYKKKIWGKENADQAGDMVGRPFEDLLCSHFRNDHRPEATASVEEYCAMRINEIRSGRIRPRETVLKSGKVVFYSGIPLSGGNFLLCNVDLTELRQRDYEVTQAHEAAARAYSLARNATETMPEGLMVIEGGRIAFVNNSLAKLLNVPEELLSSGGRWEDVFRATAIQNPQSDEAVVREGLERFAGALAAGKHVSYVFPLNEERWIHLEMRAGDNGQSVVMCSDETSVIRREAELKRLVAKAEAADRAKSEFLANMSLEIRTPMNGILGMAELLSKSPLDTRQKAFIDIIVKSGHTLMTVINDILDFSKLESGHMQLKYTSFDPAEAMEDVASLFAFKAAEKDVELIVKRSDCIPAAIMGDAGRFRQIVHNLVSNAVKFTERGHVSASIEAVDGGPGQHLLSITIEDTGIGIPADKLGSIFERFSQVEISSNRPDGTGLGLAIAQRLATILGGAISVHSTEGRGSTFTFSLPVQVAAEASRSRSLPKNVSGARVLIVDDHEVVRDHLLENVEEWGFDCVGAADAATAMSILEVAVDNGLSVDAVVIDCHMADMSGTEFAQAIRAKPGCENLAIVFLTARDIGEDEELKADIHAQAHLMKPVRTPLLRQTLIDVIRAARQRTNKANNSSIVSIRPQSIQRLPAPGGEVVSQGEPVDGPSVMQPEATVPRPYILVAEDNEVNQIFFRQILDGLAIDHRIVGNGKEALEAWQAAAPSLIFMDTSMPVLGGLDATMHIRASEAVTGGHTPIIGVITNRQEFEREHCMKAGMDDCLAKPMTPDRLEEKMIQWLGPRIQLKTGKATP
ncbi:response regulator [Rhizobium sp. KVB221]|uniref:histidine kinase n=1 Tax=Rhizobium setariae TaxID=2801340 RepID=A0A936YKP5_9HYPH|nr:response regulator [Rhizobium setariae]MBL0372100.1 response regulator [Rhizobium setariae]